MKKLFYVGSYCGDGEDSIHLLESDNGKLRKVYGNSLINSPSYLAVNKAGTRLYAVSEQLESGTIYAFAIRETGELTLLNQLPTTGGASCYVTIDPTDSYLAVANYMSGTLDVFTLEQDGSLRERMCVIQHEGRGPNEARQESAHTHFAAFLPSDRSKLLAVDLGTDSVYCYQINIEQKQLVPCGKLSVPKGSGPRHIVFSRIHPDIYYLVCELGLCVYTVKETDAGGEIIGCRPCMPEHFNGVCGAAAIRISDDGKYVYVSNRVYKPKEGMDCIACFEVEPETGCLSIPQFFKTGITEPRDINLFGDYLVAAFQSGNQVVTYALDKETGALIRTADKIDLEKPSCIVGWENY